MKTELSDPKEAPRSKTLELGVKSEFCRVFNYTVLYSCNITVCSGEAKKDIKHKKDKLDWSVNGLAVITGGG